MYQYEYWISNISKIGAITINRLLCKFGSAENVYRASESDVIPMLKMNQAAAYSSSKKKWDIYEKYEELRDTGIQFIPQNADEYPERLHNIPNSPYAIYVKGGLPRDDEFTVAVIGTRKCSDYGILMAREFGRALAQTGISVVSGMAKGIDGKAQWEVIQRGGKSYGILGCGVDVCYPEENRKLYETLPEHGGIISEYPPGMFPIAANFPARNRIVSGFADVLLVVEARERSGTSITVEMALEQGKEVFALPGRIGDERSKGCNRLIKQGACIALSPEDFIEEIRQTYVSEKILYSVGINKRGSHNDIYISRENIIEDGQGSGNEDSVLSVLDMSFISVDTISERLSCNMTVSALMNRLLELQLKGKVEGVGGLYRLI